MPAAGGAGFHGKLPARGDFVGANLPRSFVDPWDAWLQAGIAASREQLGEQWLPSYLDSPIWRFALSPGTCGPQTWAGVLMPSVDRVGRYFPLTIADPLPDGVRVTTTVASAAWFERAEALAMRALDDDRLDLEAFTRDVATLTDALSHDVPPARAALVEGFDCADLDAGGAVGPGLLVLFDRFLVESLQTYSIWWRSGGGAPGHVCVTRQLPPADRFVHLLARPSAMPPP